MTELSKRILGITGHQDIPEKAVSYLNSEIETILFGINKVECVSSLAIGADQLLAKSVLNAGGVLHAVIPCDNYEETFKEQVTLADYRYYLSKASIVDKLDHKNPSEEAFYDAGCRVADICETLIAIWDGKKAKGKGGTADIVKYARAKGKDVIILWPNGLKR